MGSPHKAAEAAGIQCELRMRELDLFTTEKGSQGGIREQPTTTQRTVTGMIEPNFSAVAGETAMATNSRVGGPSGTSGEASSGGGGAALTQAAQGMLEHPWSEASETWQNCYSRCEGLVVVRALF